MTTWLGRNERGNVVDVTPSDSGAGSQGPKGDTGDTGPAGADGAGVTQQPAITNVNREGLATTQIENLQNKVDEILTALRNAGVISS